MRPSISALVKQIDFGTTETRSLSVCHQPGSDPRVVGQDNLGRGDRWNPEVIAEELRDAYRRGKSHALVVVAEGSSYNAEKLHAYFIENRARLQFELRVTKLGHVQRGGAPTAFDPRPAVFLL